MIVGQGQPLPPHAVPRTVLSAFALCTSDRRLFVAAAAAGIPAEMASLGPMDASGDSSTVSGLKQLLLGSIATRDQAEQD